MSYRALIGVTGSQLSCLPPCSGWYESPAIRLEASRHRFHSYLPGRPTRRSAVRAVSQDEVAPTKASPKPYTSRLQSNAAYQRLKTRKQQPQETGLDHHLRANALTAQASSLFLCDAGAPQSSSPADTTNASNASAAPGPSVAKRPEPGLSHRQKDRPVGRPIVSQRAASSQSRQPSSPLKKEAALPAPAPTSSQLGNTAQADVSRRSRPALQPLSAIPNLSQGSAQSQAPVRHADFAEVEQDKNAVAVVQFWLTFHAEFGQRLRVVGSHKSLGMHTSPSRYVGISTAVFQLHCALLTLMAAWHHLMTFADALQTV